MIDVYDWTIKSAKVAKLIGEKSRLWQRVVVPARLPTQPITLCHSRLYSPVSDYANHFDQHIFCNNIDINLHANQISRSCSKKSNYLCWGYSNRLQGPISSLSTTIYPLVFTVYLNNSESCLFQWQLWTEKSLSSHCHYVVAEYGKRL